ncbi:NAD(P)H-hydrate dehydratase [Sphingomicrobium clamense]|uniref:Bifunctional NAD(P)H-hydrate repair enzyme n=1 Tax=Sphingomicrobium clamense TaxID=2851013 RepID=A0ABS6V6G1_9SPHN|nr:NAD(P)H-hydrate dehydratase [Sphingomicrobium sp. B8]MBW0145155.1 NAD(P)H-hydrate dehydratase [Sphingomicrobium sp. B8]
MTRTILTLEQMREAEQAAECSLGELMERAGEALAEAVALGSAPRAVLVLAGPGNNGGDGYVAARHLRDRGFDVRIAALADPKSDLAVDARTAWDGEVERLGDDTKPAPILIDCLFGTGLSRPLDDALAATLMRLAERAEFTIACDLPSGIETDSGALLSDVPEYDLTLALGALKPAHRLSPAMRHCGQVAVADIGIDAASDWFEIAEPVLPPARPEGHKYDRGLVQLLAGEMPGAIALAAKAAARSGAGYVRLFTSQPIEGLPDAIVQTDQGSVQDERIGCLLVGPGMGDIPVLITLALTAPKPIVFDADAIRHVGDPERLVGHDVILTPHEGELKALFGDIEGSKADRALVAAQRCQNVVVYKGADTLVAAPDGRLGFAPPAPSALATAGTGDVLSGIIATLRARGMDAFEAACAGVWIHGRAAERAGDPLIADDLIAALPDLT